MGSDYFVSSIRPWVSPNIRPNARKVLSPPSSSSSDPELGKNIFGGVGTTVVKHTWSVNASWSRSNPVETKRVVDRQRIYQVQPDGTINKSNFVDVERAKKIIMQEPGGIREYNYRGQATHLASTGNIEVLETDVTIDSSGSAAP